MTIALPQYEWQILVRRPDLSYVGPLEVATMELHPVHLALGTWALDYSWDGDPDSPAGVLATTAGCGLSFAVNNKVVISGPAAKPFVSRATSTTGDTRTVAVGGVDDKQAIFDRAAHPQPASTSPPYNSQAQDIRGPGFAETVIKQYVDVNAGPGAIVARQFPGLSIASDLGRGASVKGEASWQQLSDLVLQLAEAGGLGVSVVQVGGGLVFDVYAPTDKTAEVVFGIELGNAAGYTFGLQRPGANYDYALGSGVGTARVVQEGSDGASEAIWGRIEGVIDQGSTSDSTLLGQAITTDLAQRAAQFSVAVSALDTHMHQWAPVATDPSVATYDLGDEVTVLVEGAEVVETITEIAVYFAADTSPGGGTSNVVTDGTSGAGTRIVPIVGTPTTGDPTKAFINSLIAQLRRNQQTIRDLQRR